MKKIALFIALMCAICFVTSPALAQGPRRILFNDKRLKQTLMAQFAENTTCKGPSQIYFADKVFEWESSSDEQAAQNPCTSKYTTVPPMDGNANDWTTYAVFYSQLIKDPQEETVLDTLRTVIPANINAKVGEKHDSNNIVFAYRFTEKQNSQDLLHYVLLRAFRQSDQSVRIYKFEMIMPADTHTKDGSSAYEHFNNLINKNRSSWFKSMRMLIVQK